MRFAGLAVAAALAVVYCMPPEQLPGHYTVNALTLVLPAINTGTALTDQAYRSLRSAISQMNVYAAGAPLRLDERRISQELGISRTPVREALLRLAQEGIVRIVPRRGAWVVRKSRREMLEVITAWAALESMAARLVTLHASSEEIARLRAMFATFRNQQVKAVIDEYSETNIRFHQALLDMSGSTLLRQMAENLFIHMGWIRMRTISDGDRAARSMIDHMHIIEALEARETELAEHLVRQHSLNLAAHVEKHARYLE
jgi:DNA-binding GntR family transcriptional regulator